jgi:hypothetical protein
VRISRLSARTRFPQIFRLARKIIPFDLILLSGGTDRGRARGEALHLCSWTEPGRKFIPVRLALLPAAEAGFLFLRRAPQGRKVSRAPLPPCRAITLSSSPFCTPFSLPGALPFLTGPFPPLPARLSCCCSVPFFCGMILLALCMCHSVSLFLACVCPALWPRVSCVAQLSFRWYSSSNRQLVQVRCFFGERKLKAGSKLFSSEHTSEEAERVVLMRCSPVQSTLNYSPWIGGSK